MKNITLLAILLTLISLAAGYAIGQHAKPDVSINPELAWYRVDGTSLKGTTDKRLTIMTLKYNDVTIPCVVMDARPSALARDLFSPSLSCGWTPEILAALTK